MTRDLSSGGTQQGNKYLGGQRIKRLEDRVDYIFSALSSLANGAIDGAKGLTITYLGAAIMRLGVNGFEIFPGGRAVVYGTGNTIGQMVDGALGMATIQPGGAIGTPSTRMQPDGFLSDSGVGFIVVRVDSATNPGDGVLASSTNKWRINHTTTSNAANAYLQLDGLLMRSTSRRAYKRDIRPGYVDFRDVLKIRLRTWVDRNDDSPRPKRHFGVVAEELVDAGFDRLIERGYEGKPEGVQYERVALGAAIATAHELERRLAEKDRELADLSSTVSKLVAQVAALEAKES